MQNLYEIISKRETVHQTNHGILFTPIEDPCYTISFDNIEQNSMESKHTSRFIKHKLQIWKDIINSEIRFVFNWIFRCERRNGNSKIILQKLFVHLQKMFSKNNFTQTFCSSQKSKLIFQFHNIRNQRPVWWHGLVLKTLKQN